MVFKETFDAMLRNEDLPWSFVSRHVGKAAFGPVLPDFRLLWLRILKFT